MGIENAAVVFDQFALSVLYRISSDYGGSFWFSASEGVDIAPSSSVPAAFSGELDPRDRLLDEVTDPTGIDLLKLLAGHGSAVAVGSVPSRSSLRMPPGESNLRIGVPDCLRAVRCSSGQLQCR
jgi:hypothetical protein